MRATALQQLTERELSDLQLPGCGGLALLELIRASVLGAIVVSATARPWWCAPVDVRD
jgi:CheY-like chemotaxis protein